ncbi:MAG: EamA family transporter [Gaiella sp.]
MAAALALLGAASWGVGDFLGGLASRRAHVLTVLWLSQLVGLIGALTWAVASGEVWPGGADALAAAGGGVAGAVGLTALYRGLAIGAMGVVAPISAASPVVPLAVDLARGTAPTTVQWLGSAFVLTGIVVLSRGAAGVGGAGSAGRISASSIALALLAALGFGFFLVGLDGAASASVPWAVATARATSAALAFVAVLLLRAPLLPPRPLVPLVCGVGAFDTGANVLVAFATTVGAVGTVAVLSSLYPLTTILLARLVLGERLDRTRRVAALVALAGAALVAAG